MRPFFPPRNLALLRRMNQRNLTDRAVIWYMRDVESVSSSGNYPIIKTIEEEDVPCRLSPLDLRLPVEFATAGQYGPDAKWRVMFEAGKSIPHNRRLFITGETDGVPWERHLEVLGEIIIHREMMHFVACATLREVLAQQYYG